MTFIYYNKKSFKFITTALLVSSICFFSNSAVSQTNNVVTTSYPTQIRLGIRTTSSAIGRKNRDGSYGGFCGEFLKTLEQELSRQNRQIPVIPQGIANQYRGIEYPRYDGLIANKIEIECGPNSTSSLKLRDVQDNQPFRSKIKFSKYSFHVTGIKLLLKKETADQLQNISPNDLQEKLSALSIAVIQGTTTLNEFKANKNYYDYVPYPRQKQVNQKLDVRDLALDDLEAGKIKAFASDAIILRTLLEEGVEGEPGYRKTRQPLKNNNYVIYPQEPDRYLPHLEQQEYAIAINKNTQYAGWLKKTIDKVLEKSNLNEAKQQIKEYENGKDFSSLLPPQPPQAIEVVQADKSTPTQAPIKNKDSFLDNLVTLFNQATPAIVAVTAFITAVSGLAAIFRKNGKNEKS